MIEIVLKEVFDLNSYQNLKIHSNKMIFDKNNLLVAFDDSKKFHGMNKKFHLSQYSNDLRGKNIILLGDSLAVSNF